MVGTELRMLTQLCLMPTLNLLFEVRNTVLMAQGFVPSIGVT